MVAVLIFWCTLGYRFPGRFCCGLVVWVFEFGFGVVIVWFGVELLRGFMVVAGMWWVGRVVGGGGLLPSLVGVDVV